MPSSFCFFALPKRLHVAPQLRLICFCHFFAIFLCHIETTKKTYM